MDGIVHVLCDMQSYVYMCQSIGILVQHATFNHFKLQLCIQLNLCTYVNVGRLLVQLKSLILESMSVGSLLLLPAIL